MENKIICSLRRGSKIANIKTGYVFDILEVITDSRDPPEFIIRAVAKPDTVGVRVFGTWFNNDDWIKVK